VREVEPMPLTPGALREAWARQVARLLQQPRAPQARGPAPVTAFIPAKGGAGATFLATSFAHALSARGARVALIDLNLHVGDAALFLSDQAASMTLADLAAQAERLDGSLLESAMLRCGAGLHVLAAPRDLAGKSPRRHGDAHTALDDLGDIACCDHAILRGNLR
jgi:pilus assembly protein CpaE